MTSTESVGLCLLAFGAFVQFALKWPTLPQRKQIGAGRFPFPEPAGLSGRAHWGRGGGGGFALGLALAFGRGGPFGFFSFPFPLDFLFPPCLPKRA